MNQRIKGGVMATLLLASAAAWASRYEDGLRLKQAQQLQPAAEAFAAVLAREPGNVLAVEQLAIVQGWLGRYEQSTATWRRAIELRPGKPDYHVGLARVLYWQGERRAALSELDRALALAPDSLEALSLKGDVLLADGQRDPARQAYERSLQLPGADAAELQRKLAATAPPPAWRLDAGSIFDDYDSARGQEDSQYLQLGRQLSPALTVYGRYDRFHQFGARDQGLTAGAYWLAQPRWLLQAEAGLTLDSADFRSDSQFLLNADWLLDGPVQPLLGLRLLSYDQGEVSTVTPGLRLLYGPAALELRYGFTSNLDDSNTGVFAARLGFDTGAAAPYLSYTQGEEALPPQARADVTVLGAGCVWTLNPQWSLRADYSYEDRKDIYKHHALGGGLSYRW